MKAWPLRAIAQATEVNASGGGSYDAARTAKMAGLGLIMDGLGTSAELAHSVSHSCPATRTADRALDYNQLTVWRRERGRRA